ncbi:unnamed protein product [Durusdinium trenchii]|uniref:Uncharacterized protein n=2 Tax=Durusdinium trenchii TaxID=1381693 RepID=A0ABP0T2T1_9DINO
MPLWIFAAMISVDVGQQVFNTTQELILLEAEKAEKLLRRIKDNASKPSVHDRVTTVESTGELQLQEDIKTLQTEVEARLGRLDDLVRNSSKNVELIAEVLSSVKQ